MSFKQRNETEFLDIAHHYSKTVCGPSANPSIERTTMERYKKWKDLVKNKRYACSTILHQKIRKYKKKSIEKYERLSDPFLKG